MTIHEYGTDNQQVIVLVHPSVVMWDFFEYLIPLLKEEYHLIVPALPGYDEENPKEDFTSVEEIADELAKWLTEHKINTVDILYGCSMGGAVVLKMLAEQKIHYPPHGLRRRHYPVSTSVAGDQTDCRKGFPNDFHGKNRRIEATGKSVCHG